MPEFAFASFAGNNNWDGIVSSPAPVPIASAGPSASAEPPKIRKDFPETWIWDSEVLNRFVAWVLHNHVFFWVFVLSRLL